MMLQRRAWLLVPLALAAATGAGAQQVWVERTQPAAPAWLGVSYDVRWIQSDSQCEPQVVVERVVQGSPAERAGLRSGDAIVALNGRPVPAARLPAIAGRLSAGDSVRLRVDRDGRVRDFLAVADRRPARPPTIILDGVRSGSVAGNAPIVHVEGGRLVARNVESVGQGSLGYWLATPDGRTEYRGLGPRSGNDVDARVVRLLRCARAVEGQPALAPQLDVRQVQRRADSLRVMIARRLLEHQELEHQEPDLPALRASRLAAGDRSVAGAEVTPLVPELAEYFPSARAGLLVLRVAPGSAAARSGLLPGDVIVEAGGRRVESATELRALLALSNSDPGQLRLVRKGRTRTVTIPRP